MPIDSGERPVLVRVLHPFTAGAPYTQPPRTAVEGEIVAVERWLAADLAARGLAELA